MSSPAAKDLFAALDQTWPPAAIHTVDTWTIREGKNGGKRVSATTGESSSKISIPETAMSQLGQAHLFMIRDEDHKLDKALAKRGYYIVDPVTFYACPVRVLTAQTLPPLATFTMWPPLEIMKEIWASGDVGPSRLAVMDRVLGPKTAVLGRAKEQAAATAFVAIHQNIAMIHAIEVAPKLRRLGMGINIMRAAAQWAQNSGAEYVVLAVTDANHAANALYSSLGLTIVGRYHYRMQNTQKG